MVTTISFDQQQQTMEQVKLITNPDQPLSSDAVVIMLGDHEISFNAIEALEVVRLLSTRWNDLMVMEEKARTQIEQMKQREFTDNDLV